MASEKNARLIISFLFMSKDYLVYLGLGSNQDHPQKQLTKAIHHISRLPGTDIITFSPRYRTRAWGVTDQADFINTVLVINTSEKPLGLLNKIKKIEYRLMGRQKNLRWHQRCIDIDILYYVNKPYHRRQLQLPHPLIPERCFVLRPLMDTKPIKLPISIKRVITRHKTCCRALAKQRNVLENNKIQHIINNQC